MSNKEAIEQFRQKKNEFFRQHPHSPLTIDQRENFEGLKYFPFNPDLTFFIEPEEFEDKETIKMQTNTGDIRDFLKWGKVTFTVNGEEASLIIYASQDEQHFFMPFTDATSGKESYGAGRYLDPPRQDDGQFQIDFNQAYSPYCAYNDNYTCPIPPAENRLKVRIEAGEKAFK